MSPIRNQALLGVILQQAGLVSAERVKLALEQQSQSGKKAKIGEILAERGDLNQETADFFAERWFELATEQPKQPIGQYLKQAGLLNEQQIQTILEEQKRTQLKFGELAIAKGWLKQTTIDFFLRYLLQQSNLHSQTEVKEVNKVTDPADAVSQSEQISSDTGKHDKFLESREQQEYSRKVHEGFLQIKRKLLKLDDGDSYSEATLDRVLLWTGGQSTLTQKLFKLLSENSISLTPDEESEQIDYLVQTKLLDNWENNELGKHLQTIKDRLLNNWQCESKKLLELYRQILSQTVEIDRTKEQQELLNMGLVVKQQDRLVVANRIYQSIFSYDWVSKQLSDQTKKHKPNQAVSNSSEPSYKLLPRDRDNSIQQGKDRRQKAQQSYSNSEKTETYGRSNFFQFKNILLLLTFIGLLLLLFNNVAKRTAVRTAFWKGNQLLEQKLYTQAIAQYDRLLDRDSNYYAAWTYRGYALAGLQRYEEMHESCSTATIIESNAVYAWNCQGEALYNLSRYQEAIAAFDRAIALDRTEPIFSLNKGKSLKALGKDEESIAVVREAVEILEQIEAVKGKEGISNEFAVALTFLGNSYLKKGEEQTAIDSYTRALSYVPNYFPAQIGKGIALNIIERYSKAQNVFESILNNASLTPTQQAQTWFYLGQALCSSQQNSSGIAALEKAMKLKPDYKIAEQTIERCSRLV